MPQVTRPLIASVACLYSYNLNVFINPSYENIILEKVPIVGLTNFSITISNNSSIGKITNIIVYGSADGHKYYLSNDNIFDDDILPNTVKHVEFSLLTLFIRITCQADDNINLDVHLQGNNI